MLNKINTQAAKAIESALNLKPGQEIYLTDGKGNIIKKSKVKTDE